MSNVDLVGRPKNLYSVWRKMQAKGYGLEQLYDLRALRIVVRSKADCYWALREVSRTAVLESLLMRNSMIGTSVMQSVSHLRWSCKSLPVSP